MRYPTPTTTPQRPSICKPLKLVQRQNSAGPPPVVARSMSAAGTLDIDQTPRPVRSTTQMSRDMPTPISPASAAKIALGVDYEALTDSESGGSALLTGASTVGSSARTISSSHTGKTPSTGRGRSGGSVSVATDEGAQWEQPSQSSLSPVRAKKSGGYGSQRRTQSEDGEEFLSDQPKEMKRHALTVNLRQKEKVLRAHIRQKLVRGIS